MEEIRLNKYLSDRGVCSRREADRLTEEGRILVNGKPASLGQKVTDADEIRVNGALVDTRSPEKVIIALNKPTGYVCTTKDFRGEENVLSLIDYNGRLYPVGRLDKDSEGLLFLTNDGAFASEITKASGKHEKEYEGIFPEADGEGHLPLRTAENDGRLQSEKDRRPALHNCPDAGPEPADPADVPELRL